VPKPSGLLTSREKEICGRVRELRNRAALSQQEFSNLLGLSRAQVAALEMPWSTLRYAVADRLCQKFNICQRWLATGADPLKGYVEIAAEIAVEIGPRELFSIAYDQRIQRTIDAKIKDDEILSRALAVSPSIAEKIREDRLYNLAQVWFSRIPPHLYQDYFGTLMAASSDFYHAHKKDIPLELQSPEIHKIPLIEPSLKHRTDAAMKDVPTLKGLLVELKRFAKIRGNKAKIARKFGVSEASVSEWLRGKKEPSGEITLRLLRWVNEGTKLKGEL